MTLAYPLGLLGLLSLPVIITLHLLRERKKRYVVSSLSLWTFLEKEVQGSRASRIPLTWLLLVDLLVAVLLSLALAQPHIELSLPESQKRQIIVLLDTSTSMATRDVLPNRFTQAKQDVLYLIGASNPIDIVTLITFDSRPHWIGDTRQTTQEDLLSKLDNLEAGGTTQGLEGALSSAVSVMEKDTPAEINIFTDGDYPPLQQNLDAYPIRWHLYGLSVDNQAVLEIISDRISQDTYQVFARLANFGDKPAQRVVSLLADGKPINSVTLDLPAMSTLPQVWELKGTPHLVSVLLAGSDQLKDDDQADYGIPSSIPLQIGLVTDQPDPIEKALRALPDTNVRVLKPEEYLPGMSFDIVIFRGTLPTTWPDGHVLVFNPPENSSLLPLTALKPIQSPAISGENDLLKGIDFSGLLLDKVWNLQDVLDGFSPILQSGDAPIIIQGQIGRSQITVMLTPLESGNLTRHPAFPILIARLVQSSRSPRWPAAIHTGEELALPPAQILAKITIRPPQGEAFEWQKDYPNYWDDTSRSGAYQIDTVNLDGVQESTWIGVNTGDIQESNLRPQSWMKNTSREEALQSSIITEKDISLMPWLMGLALIVLLLEATLAWK